MGLLQAGPQADFTSELPFPELIPHTSNYLLQNSSQHRGYGRSSNRPLAFSVHVYQLFNR